MDEKPTSKKRAGVYLQAAFQALQEAGGSLPWREIKTQVAARVTLSDLDKAVYEKTGYVRWESVLHFYSVDCVKAGYIRKHAGQWHITPEGLEVLPLGPDELIERASRAYRAWNAARRSNIPGDLAPPIAAIAAEASDEAERAFVFETAESQASAEIQEYVRALGPYEFQDLVAALLRGMGYSTPFISPKGPDGGTDILAYRDPLGTQTPHIRVQVKHRLSNKATREEVAALRGIIRQDREVGLFVSSGGFTSEAEREARHGGVHMELMSLDRLLELWSLHYDAMTEPDRAHLRLRRVSFLAPD